MPHLRVPFNYWSHKKVVKLMSLLGRGSEVLPLRLWGLCGENHYESGRLTDSSAEEIKLAVGWWGEPGKMIDALKRSEFLRPLLGGYEVWGLEEPFVVEQGHIFQSKRVAKLAAKARWGGQHDLALGSTVRYADSIDEAQALSGRDGSSTPSSTASKNSSTIGALQKEFLEMQKKAIGEYPSNFSYPVAGTVFRKLLAISDEVIIRERMIHWFDSTDPFIKDKNAFSVGLFGSRFSLLKNGPLTDGKVISGYAKPKPGAFDD